MTGYLIHNATILIPGGEWKQGWLLVENSKITEMGEGLCPAELRERPAIELIDGTGLTALPGFIDVHVHGAVGCDTMDATPKALQSMAKFFASKGVTSFLPTTMTADTIPTQKALENVAACMGRVEQGATILGAHLEGPYINEKMKGAQVGKLIRRANPSEYRQWLDTGAIKQITVAPEFPENMQFIEECVKRSINVSIGHTEATYGQVQNAIQAGARQATHTFNAMIGLHHRKPGTVGAVLASDDVFCEMIVDNVHIHPAVVKVAVRAAGVDRVILITDAISGTGMPDGQYELGGQAVTVERNTASLAGGVLAGSILTLDAGLRNTIEDSGIPLCNLWPATSTNAAHQLGIADRKGKLVSGYDADIVLLNSAYNVTMTIAEGRIVYRK